MKKSLLIIFHIFLTLGIITLFHANLYSADLEIVAEKTNYQKTSTYNDVMDFLFEAQRQSPRIKILKLTDSFEGRMIPMVILSNEGIKNIHEMQAVGKPPVLIMANIHAGEIEGKEASMMLIRDIVNNKAPATQYLDNQVILMLPIFNADGNDKFGKNRGDNGPELAGVRYNGQSLDLNRDYLKMESPEITALIQLFNSWDPVLIVDMHTTNGSRHRNPVTYAAQVNPDVDQVLADYMWKKLLPAVSDTLKKTYGYNSVPYGVFKDRSNPGAGWLNYAFNARYGNNYAGLRNRFTILDENYSHADFKTRVLSSFGFIKSILEYTNQHIVEMQKMARESDLKTINNFYKEKFTLEFENKPLFDVTLKSFEYKKIKITPENRDKYPPWVKDYVMEATKKHKDYRMPYYSKPVPTRSIGLPEAYVIPPGHPEIIEKIKAHGIVVEKTRNAVTVETEVFKIKDIKLAKRLYQGHAAVTLSGSYETRTQELPAHSYFISMKQPLARLLPVLLEPESEDSLASWGFFNRQLVSQWGGSLLDYPVLRIKKLDASTYIERFQD
jgi:hypothetical protein